MSERRTQEAVYKSRRAFRALLEGFGHLGSDDPSNAGWTLLGYAEYQVELLDARLKRLGVDTALGLDPVHLLADARPPAGDKQTIALMSTVFEARRWFAVYYSGMRAVHIAVGEETLAMVLAAHHRRLVPISREETEYLLNKMGTYILENMLYTWERCLVFEAGTSMEEMPTKRLREVVRDIFTGWARANIKRTGNVGGRLRRALGNEGKLMQELPGAVSLAWKDMGPKEPLRSTGDRSINLARRIAKRLEDAGDEAAKRHDFVESTPVDDLSDDLSLGTDDLGFAGFEAREEAARQLLDALEQAAKLSPQQAAVWKQTRGRLSVEEIAEELGISKNQVSVQRHNAMKKLGEAREAAGL